MPLPAGQSCHTFPTLSNQYEFIHDMQFYARGMFASPAIGWCSSRKDAGLLGQLQKGAWALSAVLHSSLDWPIRRLSQGSSSCPSCANAVKGCTVQDHSWGFKHV